MHASRLIIIRFSGFFLFRSIAITHKLAIPLFRSLIIQVSLCSRWSCEWVNVCAVPIFAKPCNDSSYLFSILQRTFSTNLKWFIASFACRSLKSHIKCSFCFIIYSSAICTQDLTMHFVNGVVYFLTHTVSVKYLWYLKSWKYAH